LGLEGAVYQRFAPGADQALFAEALRIRLAEMALGETRRPGPVAWLVDRVLFLARAFTVARTVRRRGSRPLARPLACYDPGSASESTRRYRSALFERCGGFAVDYVGGGEPLVTAQVWDEAVARRVAGEARGMALRALTDFGGQRWRWLAEVYADLYAIQAAAYR
jgi:hypothetical protein